MLKGDILLSFRFGGMDSLEGLKDAVGPIEVYRTALHSALDMFAARAHYAHGFFALKRALHLSYSRFSCSLLYAAGVREG